MDPVSRADTLSQFVKLVGAARVRNNGFPPFAKTSRPASPSLLIPGAPVALQQPGYTTGRVSPDRQEAMNPAALGAQSVRKLGTRFDAYA
jgi:hypothetical protein